MNDTTINHSEWQEAVLERERQERRRFYVGWDGREYEEVE